LHPLFFLIRKLECCQHRLEARLIAQWIDPGGMAVARLT
jgi:hypothetical protein